MTEEYVYENDHRETLFRVVRRAGKRFSQESWDGERWSSGRNGTAPVPYRLPELLAAVEAGDTIYVAEGEKDVLALAEAGVAATTNPGGAGKWPSDFAQHFEGADVVVVRDRDEPGMAHALDVEAKLRPVAASVRHARAREGKDAADHLAAGYGVGDLVYKRPRRGGKKSKAEDRNGAIPRGERNGTLTSLAGGLRRAGSTEAQIAKTLLLVNQEQCSEPLPDADVRTIAKSVARYEPTTASRKLIVRRASDVPIEKIRWLWEQRLGLGTLGVLAGRPGEGKSTLALYLAAAVTRGTLPGDLHGTPADVLAVSYEDQAQVIAARLKAADADLDGVHIVGVEEGGQRGMVGLPDDLPRIAEVVREVGARLVIVDPVLAGVSRGVDTHKDAEVRSVLAPVAGMAEELDVAVLGISHFTKSGEIDVLMRIGGSIGVVAAARSILALGRDPDDDDPRSDRRVLAHAKTNIGTLAPSLALRVVGAQVEDVHGELVETSQVVVVGEHAADADSLLLRTSPGERSKTSDAEVFLRGELAAGERAVGDLKTAANSASVDWGGVERARRRLGAVPRREGFGSGGRWFWARPEDDAADEIAERRRRRRASRRRRRAT